MINTPKLDTFERMMNVALMRLEIEHKVIDIKYQMSEGFMSAMIMYEKISEVER